MENTEHRSPVSRHRPLTANPKPPPRVGVGRNVPPPPTAAQQIATDHELLIMRLSRAIPVGLVIPSHVLQEPAGMSDAWATVDAVRFRDAAREYQQQVWRWFQSTPEGVAFLCGQSTQGSK